MAERDCYCHNDCTDRTKVWLFNITPIILALVLCVTSALIDSAKAEHRVALVIGNASYTHATPLKNPLNDAAKVGDTLRRLDFAVTVVTDADKMMMESAIRRFSADMEGADVALFYYSGHAIQVDDQNYIVPVSANIEGPRNLSLDTYSLQDIADTMRRAGTKVQLLFLDACRDNPFSTSLSTVAGVTPMRGLARVQLTSGSLIAFSTSPGEGALDGSGQLSPFTDAFIRYASVPKLEIRQVMTRIRADVSTSTGQRQTPWDNSSLLGDFYLVPHRPPPMFDRLSHVSVSTGGGAQHLYLKAPEQPEGGTVQINVTQVPVAGHLVLDGREVVSGERLSASDFEALAYEIDSEGDIDNFSFTVDDAWGNSVAGRVMLDRGHASVASIIATKQPLAALQTNAISLLGLGPNLIFRDQPKIPIESRQHRIRLASNLPFGQIVLGERVIEVGRSIEASDISKLSFNPPTGYEGHHLDAIFDGDVDGSSAEIKIGIDVSLTDCDRLAGDRLDQQGVSEGVLTGLIDTAAALPACQTALQAKPAVGRFAYQLGRVYAALGRDTDSMAMFHKAADLGHVRAIWALGNHDISVPPAELARGKAFLEQAAVAGDVYAVHSLGNLYYDGRGVTRDLDKAKALYETAARMGHTFAMNALGQMYEHGDGVPINKAMTRRYWNESAARGDMYGVNNLGYVYLDGVDVPPDPLRAIAYFKKAAELGHPEAPNAIGRLYVLGKGVPVDFVEARKWYTIGADRGDAWAAYNLGDLYSLGHGGSPDQVLAGYYEARAAASLNHLDVAEMGRRRLLQLDRRMKLSVLSRLVSDITLSPPASSEKALITTTQQAMQLRGIKLQDTTLDSMLVGAAQAVWLERSKRADLF